MGFITNTIQLSGNTTSVIITGITSGLTTLTDNDNTLVTERAIKNYIGEASASISNPEENSLLTSDGTTTGINSESNLKFVDNSLILNNTSEVYATGTTLNNNTTTNINLIQTGITEYIKIEYKAKRGVDFMSGTIEIYYDPSGSTLHIDDMDYSYTNDIGLSFDADVSNGIIRLNATVTDNVNNIDYKYIRKIIK